MLNFSNEFYLPIGWHFENLMSMIDVIGGVSYSPCDITTEGVRIIRGGNIQNGSIVLKNDDVFLSHAYSNSINSLRKGDIVLVASTGSVEALGRTATVWEDIDGVQIGAFLRILRPKNSKYANFLSAWLSSVSFLKYIRKVAKGTSINNIGKSHLEGFQIPIPSDKELRIISRIYEIINRKIYNNKAISDTLEKIAKQLYDYWFVQFDFPDENGRPYKSSGGKMVYNEVLKREIPEGWSCVSLYDVAQHITKSIVPKPNVLYYHYSIPAFDSGMLYKTENGKDINSNKFVLEDNEVLVSKLNPHIPRVLLSGSKQNSICSTEYVIVKPIESIFKYFIYTLLKQPAFISYSMNNVTGTSHSHSRCTPESIMRYKFPYNESIVRRLSLTLSPLYNKSFFNNEQNIELTNLRDFLLPLLMNGQVRIN